MVTVTDCAGDRFLVEKLALSIVMAGKAPGKHPAMIDLKHEIRTIQLFSDPGGEDRVIEPTIISLRWDMNRI